jgi:hypothetical protein
MDRYFSADLSPGRFALNTLIVSCAALLPVLILYISLAPHLWQSLVHDRTALAYFMRQVLTNGLPVVFWINFAGFSLYAEIVRGPAARTTASQALLIDIPARIVLFITLHAIIYIGSARLFGSFAGDSVEALKAVAPTLARSAGFGNLSGAYLYATAVSAIPLYVAALRRLDADNPGFSRAMRGAFFFLPFSRHPGRSFTVVASLTFAVVALATSAIAALLAAFQT